MTDPTGYDPAFLDVTVPAPEEAEGRGLTVLASTHFSVAMDATRRLAAWTGVNIAGDELLDVERGDDWELDPRLSAERQTGAEVYSRNDLDRGHLVRRRDPVWGDRALAELANRETFRYTNAAPQASAFNQGEELWVGLEDYLLDAARASGARLSVFTGPVFASGDARYRGVLIPRRFWKTAAWVVDGELRATAYVLDQSALVERFDDDREAGAADPDIGAFRTFQVPVADVAALTALGLDALVAADRFGRNAAAADGRWRELSSRRDVEAGLA